MVLLVQLLQDLPRFNVKEPTTNTAAADSKAKSNEMYENGLSDKEVEVISSTMFGPGSVENSPRKQRLLQSTIELGFPKAGTLKIPPCSTQRYIMDVQRTGMKIAKRALKIPCQGFGFFS